MKRHQLTADQLIEKASTDMRGYWQPISIKGSWQQSSNLPPLRAASESAEQLGFRHRSWQTDCVLWIWNQEGRHDRDEAGHEPPPRQESVV
jgi:hypothetical protein